jgi:hypothetical protein
MAMASQIHKRVSHIVLGSSKTVGISWPCYRCIHILKTVQKSFILMKLSLLSWNSYHLSLHQYGATSAYLMPMKLWWNLPETGRRDSGPCMRSGESRAIINHAATGSGTKHPHVCCTRRPSVRPAYKLQLQLEDPLPCSYSRVKRV